MTRKWNTTKWNFNHAGNVHYSEVIMSAMASQITGVLIVCLNVCSVADRRKHQSSMSLAFVRGIHRWQVNSPHKGPGGCFTNASRALQRNLAKIYNARNHNYSENFKLKICTCAQSKALGTHTKFQLEILIRSAISAIHKFRENMLESSRNVSETTPRTLRQPNLRKVRRPTVPWKGRNESPLIDIHSSIKAIHQSVIDIMDIHNSNMDVYNPVMYIHNTITDIQTCRNSYGYPWLNCGCQ